MPGEVTVLLVDPNADQRGMYCEALRHAGFRVIECPDGRGAVAVAASARPAVIVTEVGSERAGCGWELIGTLRRDPRTTDIPIIALGSRWVSQERKEAKARGATTYFVLPLTPSELVSAVGRLTA